MCIILILIDRSLYHYRAHDTRVASPATFRRTAWLAMTQRGSGPSPTPFAPCINRERPRSDHGASPLPRSFVHSLGSSFKVHMSIHPSLSCKTGEIFFTAQKTPYNNAGNSQLSQTSLGNGPAGAPPQSPNGGLDVAIVIPLVHPTPVNGAGSAPIAPAWGEGAAAFYYIVCAGEAYCRGLF